MSEKELIKFVEYCKNTSKGMKNVSIVKIMIINDIKAWVSILPPRLIKKRVSSFLETFFFN